MVNKRVAVIGSGRIGRAWAIVFARAGFEVRLHDADRTMLDGAIPSIRDSVADLREYGLIEEPDEQIVSRVTACEKLADAVRDVDLVQENITEIVEVKRALFADLDKLTRPDTLLAS
jgi:L-gulonate 3-dehydrogenase